MSPEQERRLYEVLDGVARIEEKLDALVGRLREHESADEAAHSRIGDLETHKTRLYAIWAAACVIVPAVSWFLVVLGKAGTP